MVLVMVMDSIAHLVEVLRDRQLLEPAQMEELDRWQTQFAGPADLAQDLSQRGWLTRYQVDELMQGRGRNLVLGQYVLLDLLGEGGMGKVFKARHRLMGRFVALKTIRKELLSSATTVQRFQREIRAAGHLSH